MTGSSRHICSAPRTGNRFKQKCRIISGMDLNGRLNCPRMYSPVSFCLWILICMNPFALLNDDDGEKRKFDFFHDELWCNYGEKCKKTLELTSTIRNNPVLPIHCFVPESCPRSMLAAHFRHRFVWLRHDTICVQQESKREDFKLKFNYTWKLIIFETS